MKICIITIALLALTGCAASPKIIEKEQANDNYLNCYQLKNAIAEAEYYKKESRKDDKFKLKYMMPLNAVMSVININRAESAAIDRMKHLQQIYQQKGCDRMNNQYYPNSYQRNNYQPNTYQMNPNRPYN